MSDQQGHGGARKKTREDDQRGGARKKTREDDQRGGARERTGPAIRRVRLSPAAATQLKQLLVAGGAEYGETAIADWIETRIQEATAQRNRNEISESH